MTNSLDFLKSKITYAYIDGQWWFPIKPICDALNIDAQRQKRTISSSPILAPYVSIQTCMVEGDTQTRKHLCINERRVYMWLGNVKGEDEGLIKFQIELADKIYDLLRGSLVAISAAATAKRQADIAVAQAKAELGSHPAYIRLKEAETRRTSAVKKLNASAGAQPDLFN